MTTAVLSTQKTHKHFKIGDTLIYYHKWKKWEKPQDQQWFESLDDYALDQLAPGDEVWIDVDPLYHHGKVYGCVLARITDVQGTVASGLCVSYGGGDISGRAKVSKDYGRHKFRVLTDEEFVYIVTKDVDAARNV